MKQKIAKVVIGMLLIIIGVALLILAYYMIADIETKVPKEVEATCELKIESFMGRKIFVVTPKIKEKTNLKILYIHGGAYVAEATKEHWEFIEKLANDTGATIVLPDYPLTPKYTYKDVFGMMIPLYKELIDHVETNDLMIMGDSAGGGIALALEERIGEENIAMPNQTVLISPWLDVRLENPKIEEVQKKDHELNRDTLRLSGLAYASDDGIDSYLVNPIEGDLTRLKNVTILTGTNDILNPDVYVLKERAEKTGNSITIKEYEGAGHIWMIERNSSEELIDQGYQDILSLIRNKK